MDTEKIIEVKIHLQLLLNQAQDFVQGVPAVQLFAAIATLLITLFFCLIVPLFKRRPSNTVLLTGLDGSGKTVIFYQLRDGSSHQGTLTSMEPNEETFVLHSQSQTSKKGKVKPVTIINVPFHSQLDEFLSRAACIVFVIDSVEFLPNIRAASKYLYGVLTNAIVVTKKIPLLLLCNKVDKVTAHTKDFISKQLEKEINKLCTTGTAVTSADLTNEYALGVPGEAFVFHRCVNKVIVAEASGLTGEIYQLEQFIRECAKP